MSCIEPGEVVIVPRRPDGDPATDLDIEFPVVFSARELFSAQEVSVPADVSLPFIVEVLVGQEVEYAASINSHGAVVAVPNFKVSLTGPTFDLSPRYLSSIESLFERDAHDGTGVSVAIIDEHVGTAAAVEYDVSRPGQSSTNRHTSQPSHGGVIGRIIGHIAPGARIESYALGSSLNIGGVVTALALARSLSPGAAIINMSFALSCEPKPCANCGQPGFSSIHVSQLEFLFTGAVYTGPQPLLVAAAGNNRAGVAMPARFEGVLAVSAYEPPIGETPAYVKHLAATPSLVVAPGSARSGDNWVTKSPVRMGGTSFSAAVVSGIAARYASASPLASAFVASPDASALLPWSWRNELLARIFKSATTDISGFDPARHGRGLARYDSRWIRSSITAVGNRAPTAVYSEFASGFDELRQHAYALWEAEGRPNGRALDHWLRAKRACGVPDGVFLPEERATASRPAVLEPRRSTTDARPRPEVLEQTIDELS